MISLKKQSLHFILLSILIICSCSSKDEKQDKLPPTSFSNYARMNLESFDDSTIMFAKESTFDTSFTFVVQRNKGLVVIEYHEHAPLDRASEQSHNELSFFRGFSTLSDSVFLRKFMYLLQPILKGKSEGDIIGCMDCPFFTVVNGNTKIDNHKSNDLQFRDLEAFIKASIVNPSFAIRKDIYTKEENYMKAFNADAE